MATELEDIFDPVFDEDTLDDDIMNVVPLGVVFLPTGGEKELLSEAMKVEWDWHQPRKCVVCGNEFMPKARRHKFCSIRCQTKSYNDNRELSQNVKVEICQWCGKKFVGWRGKKNKYCSKSCLSTATAYKKKAKGTLGFQVNGKEMSDKAWAGYVKMTPEEKRNAKRESARKYRITHSEEYHKRHREEQRRYYQRKKEREKATNE